MMTRRSLLGAGAALITGFFGYQLGQREETSTEKNESKPLIGIASVTKPDYIEAVKAAGGLPVILPISEADDLVIDSYLERLDGLLMPGGPDIPPSEYGEEAHPTVSVLGDDRYQFEKKLITSWINKTDKPLLGICLGSQWINIASGGSLIQDIPSEFGVSHRKTDHPVTLESDSRLAKILEGENLEVNSHHHQAVRNLGKGLRIVARSPEGIVEGFEGIDEDRFLVGVQWHPEKMIAGDQDAERQLRLLRAFVQAATLHAQ